MYLFFIRHAQSENNAIWATTGGSTGRNEDPEVTDLGAQQVEALAKMLKDGDDGLYYPAWVSRPVGFGITHLYSSLMVRSVKTGTIIAKALGLRLYAWEDLHECGGIYLDDEETGEKICLPGKDRAYFARQYPEFILHDQFIETGWWDRRPVESADDSFRRARRLLETLRERHGDQDVRIAIVSHGGFYNELMTALLNIPRENRPWFELFNTGITCFRMEKNRKWVIYHNRTDHLKPEWIT